MSKTYLAVIVMGDGGEQCAHRDGTRAMKYAVYLTNPDDIRVGVSSYSSGRYGFTLRAGTLSEAISSAVARSRADGFYGHDWSARIVRVGDLARDRGADAIVALRDDLDDPAFACYRAWDTTAVDGGGVRLW